MSSIFHPTCDYMCRPVEVYAMHICESPCETWESHVFPLLSPPPTNKRFKSTCKHTVFTCEIRLDPASQLFDSGPWLDRHNTWMRFDLSPAGPGFGCVQHASFEALSGVEQRENTQKHPGQGSLRTRVEFLSPHLHHPVGTYVLKQNSVSFRIVLCLGHSTCH